MYSFSIGEVVICVIDIDYYGDKIYGIEIGNKYTIKHVDGNYIIIINDYGIKHYYPNTKFVSLTEYRDDVINNIIK